MRCPDCNKFVSYDTEYDPEEVNDPEIVDGCFQVSYRRVLPCVECGYELKDYELEVEQDVSGDIEDDCPKAEGGHHEWDFDLNVEATEDVQRTDRHGKPIKLARYMKTLYGVHVHGSAVCNACGAECAIDCENSEAASSFEELVL